MKESRKPPDDDRMWLLIERFTDFVQKNSKKVVLATCSLFFLIAALGLVSDRSSKSGETPRQKTSEPPAISGAGLDASQPLTISPTAISFDVGETVYLTVSNNIDEITWMSSETGIAVVSDGTVTGVAAGSAVVTAVSGEEKVTCMITVTDPEIDRNLILKLNHADITISSNDPPAQLKVRISGTRELYEGKITWASSNTDVAAVSDTGLVERIGRGSAVITAEANGQTLECLVRIP